MSKKIEVTLVTGSLGSGKTTIILNLVKQLPSDYKAVWLKNEYGDINIDSKLAQEKSIRTEGVLNGCLCCVLVGKLYNALDDIISKYSPDRIIIETAGTAYPFPIINQIEKFEKLRLDGVIQVIDAVNFKKFADSSYIAETQAKFVDLIIINKVGLVTEQQLYEAEEYVYGIYLNNPKVKTNDGFVDKDLLIGIDSKLANTNNFNMLKSEYLKADNEHDNHHTDEVEVFGFKTDKILEQKKVEEIISGLNKVFDSEFFRIKGIIKTSQGYKLLNWVCGRLVWEDLTKYEGETEITFMGKNILVLEKDTIQKLQNI